MNYRWQTSGGSAGADAAATASSSGSSAAELTRERSVKMKENKRPNTLKILRRTSSCSAMELKKKRQRNQMSEKEKEAELSNQISSNLTRFTAESLAEGAASTGIIRVPSMTAAGAVPPSIFIQPLREGVEHISELVQPDPPCHFCLENTSRPVHEDCTRLKIVSRGNEQSNSINK